VKFLNGTAKSQKQKYIVSQKKPTHYNIVHNFDKCWLIFKIISLTDMLVNVQQNCH